MTISWISGECIRALNVVRHGPVKDSQEGHSHYWLTRSLFVRSTGYDRTKICGILMTLPDTTLLFWPRREDMSILHHTWEIGESANLYRTLVLSSSDGGWIMRVCAFIGRGFLLVYRVLCFKTRKMAPLGQKAVDFSCSSSPFEEKDRGFTWKSHLILCFLSSSFLAWISKSSQFFWYLQFGGRGKMAFHVVKVSLAKRHCTLGKWAPDWP